MDSQIQKSDQTHVFPKITAEELRVYLKEVFPRGKFRVQPRGTFVTGGGTFFFTDRKVFHQHQQQRGNVG